MVNGCTVGCSGLETARALCVLVSGKGNTRGKNKDSIESKKEKTKISPSSKICLELTLPIKASENKKEHKTLKNPSRDCIIAV